MDFTLTNVILILQMVVSGVEERMTIMNKNKHLSFEERKTIAERLNEGASFKAISRELGRDSTTVSKEVRKHTTKRQTGAIGTPYNNCKYRRPVVKLGFVTSVLHANSDTIVVIATNAIPFVLNTNLSHVQNYLSLLMSVTTAQTIISDAP